MKKARQGSCWVIAGVGYDFSISNARFLQVLGSKSNPAHGGFEALGFVSNPAAVGSNIY
ncbi:hypothetical protein SLEP1_g37115 [Rubroshorea leprosula]|uniref:Uncharacterized protein n=1 Tax=Rubroshorea leprosula TaxID=152421 RepID=A0AAV5KUC3_9ROSI|nr:hypothetical protein SLEP1_g37115 [Rubroshorea leprosula]